MTNFEKIASLSIEEFAGWIDNTLSLNGDEPWNKWFDEEYCKKCEPIKGIINAFYSPYSPYSSVKVDCAFCEVNDYCKFFPHSNSPLDTKDVITMWLKREVEEQHL